MNEDQLYDAAEREMDLYRAEITRITAARDEARELLDEATRVMLLTRGTADAAIRIRKRAGLPS